MHLPNPATDHQSTPKLNRNGEMTLASTHVCTPATQGATMNLAWQMTRNSIRYSYQARRTRAKKQTAARRCQEETPSAKALRYPTIGEYCAAPEHASSQLPRDRGEETASRSFEQWPSAQLPPRKLNRNSQLINKHTRLARTLSPHVW